MKTIKIIILLLLLSSCEPPKEQPVNLLRTVHERGADVNKKTIKEILPKGAYILTDGEHFAWISLHGSSLKTTTTFSTPMEAAKDCLKWETWYSTTEVREEMERLEAAKKFVPMPIP